MPRREVFLKGENKDFPFSTVCCGEKMPENISKLPVVTHAQYTTMLWGFSQEIPLRMGWTKGLLQERNIEGGLAPAFCQTIWVVIAHCFPCTAPSSISCTRLPTPSGSSCIAGSHLVDRCA